MRFQNATIDTGLIGPDWEPSENERYYAQIIYKGGNYIGMGATEELAWADLLRRIQENRGE